MEPEAQKWISDINKTERKAEGHVQLEQQPNKKNKAKAIVSFFGSGGGLEGVVCLATFTELLCLS